MKMPQIWMIGMSDMHIYTVPNYEVEGGNKFGNGSITSEQIRKVYADIVGRIDEIQKVHPKVCLEIRTGSNVTDPDSREPMVCFHAYRYPEGSGIPEYMSEVEEGSLFGVYECKKGEHSPGFECGPWIGRVGDTWSIMVEVGDEATKRKQSLEKVCGFS